MHPSSFAHWSLSTARDLTLEAARDASNVRRAPTRELPSSQLKKLLDSRSERDVLEGLRRVITVCQPYHEFGPSQQTWHALGRVVTDYSPSRCLIDNPLRKHCLSSPT